MLILLRVMLVVSVVIGATSFLCGCTAHYKCNINETYMPNWGAWETNMPPQIVVDNMQETGGASAENVGYNKVKAVPNAD